MFKTKYRIVTDEYSGFEVQSWRWYFPIWLQCHTSSCEPINTHSSLEKAKLFIENKKRKRKILCSE